MHCEVQNITPERAKQLLQANTANRPITKMNVQRFENQLRRGEFMLTHQGIAISEDGRLLDGQHRLLAIVNTGISAPMLVTTGLCFDSFQVLDTGRNRTGSDVLAIHGATSTSTMAAAIRLYLLYVTVPRLVWSGRYGRQFMTPLQINEEYGRDSEAWSWAVKTATSFTVTKIVTPASLATLLYLAATHQGYSREYLKQFCSRLSQGDGLLAGNPILAFRNKVIGDNSRLLSQARLADYIKLFNAFTSGQSLKIFKQQSFPPMPTILYASESIHEGAEA